MTAPYAISASWKHWQQVLAGELDPHMVIALQSIDEIFALYDPMPFGLQREEFMAYALAQFNQRMNRLERAQHQTVTEIERQEIEEA